MATLLQSMGQTKVAIVGFGMNRVLPRLSSMYCTVREMSFRTLMTDWNATTHPLPRVVLTASSRSLRV